MHLNPHRGAQVVASTPPDADHFEDPSVLEIDLRTQGLSERRPYRRPFSWLSRVWTSRRGQGSAVHLGRTTWNATEEGNTLSVMVKKYSQIFTP